MAAGAGDRRRARASRRTAASPMIHGLVADTIGGTADAAHADVIEHETLASVEGVARPDVQDLVRAGAAGGRRAASAW